jgi:hypothetical protein
MLAASMTPEKCEVMRKQRRLVPGERPAKDGHRGKEQRTDRQGYPFQARHISISYGAYRAWRYRHTHPRSGQSELLSADGDATRL